MATFDSLPAELQIYIFSHLQAPDVKAARAVSRKLRNNATPALFRSIVACARYEALGALQKVSLHSVYPSYVKEIIFDGTLYEETEAEHQDSYSRALRMDKSLDLDNSRWSNRGRWQRYQTLFREQEEMKDSGVLLQTLARALENMPNITSIVYSPFAHLIPIERKVVRDLLPRGSPWGDTGGYLRTGRFIPTNRFIQWGHPFRLFIAAIYLAQYTGIRQFTVERCPEGKRGSEFSLDMFHFPDTNNLRAGRFLFQQLIKLDLSLVVAKSGNGEYCGVQQLVNLAELLAAAQDLRHLAVHIPYWAPSAYRMYGHIFQDDRALFRPLGLDATWPKLRSFNIGGVYADEQDLIDLIRRHKDTLRSLIFSKCSLATGIWAEVVDEVIFNASMIATFTLDCVNEARGETFTNMSPDGREIWSYKGRLVVQENGERTFSETDPDRKSVYEPRRD